MNAAISMSELSSTDKAVASPLIAFGQLAALVVSALLHFAVAALLLGWQPEPPPAAAAISVEARLIALPPASRRAPAEPQSQAPLPTPAVAEPAPAELAELARRRIERDEQVRRQRVERQRIERERLERQQRELAEQRTRAEAQAAQQAQLDAERAAAAQAAAATEAASRRYEPIEKIAPGYPARAMERRIEGDCTVRYTVSSSGRVENPEVIGECHPLFAMPSLVAAKRFRYQPRIVQGRAVAVPDVTNTFHYRIQPQN